MKFRSTGHSVFKPFGYHWSGVGFLDDVANKKEEGWGIISTWCVVACAASVEACVNHVGPLAIGESWKERWSWRDKVSKLSQRLNFPMDQDPILEVQKTQVFRDWMLHGKTVDEDYDFIHEKDSYWAPLSPQTLEYYFVDENRQKAIDAAYEFMRILLVGVGLNPNEMHSMSYGGGSTELIEA